MKDARFLFAAVATAMAVLVLTSCSDVATTEPEDNGSALYVDATTTTADLVAMPVEFEDASIENAVRVKPHPSDSVKPNVRDAKVPHPFARLLAALDLTAEQREQVAGFLETHKACVSEAMQLLREYASTIIEEAKAARAEVLAKLEAGEITREEAVEAIRAINARARAALKNSEVFTRIREMIKACDEEFLRSLASILNEEQMAILQRYLNHRNGNPPVGTRG